MLPVVKCDHRRLLDHRLADGSSLAGALSTLAGQRPHLPDELAAWRGKWPLGWLDLPSGGGWVDACQETARRLRKSGNNLIVCGIGGSALGTQAVLAALDTPSDPLSDRVLVLDNVDPVSTLRMLGGVDWPRTAVNVISKSGGTLETMSSFFYVLERMQKAGLNESEIAGRICATTDPQKGLLREMAQARGWATQPVPPDVGGRFSVLSPVGLLPLAFAGVDIARLLEGAHELQEHAQALPLSENPAWRLAAVQYLLHTRSGVRETVQYIYGDPLIRLGDWFRQLWAESLAKATGLDGAASQVCLTPVVARGATDQHSQNQLYMEGPGDKLFSFITAERWPVDAAVTVPDDPAAASLMYFSGKAFAEILGACYRGTRDALREAGRPVLEIAFPQVDAHTVGAYLQLWMLATAYAGLLYNVNTFDQPGVEASKKITHATLSKS